MLDLPLAQRTGQQTRLTPGAPAGHAACPFVTERPPMPTLQFQVDRRSLGSTRVVQLPDAPLQEGQVRVRVEHFAYTANNITYAAFGDAMNYWQFFPVAGNAGPAPSTEGSVDAAEVNRWGCIPVWGFGVVTHSRQPQLAEGQRLYGYWPMASHAVLEPTRITAAGFADAAAHRQALHAVYNQYLRCEADPFYSAETEAEQALLRPLYLTAWLIDDFLADNDWFGAAQAEGGQRERPQLLLSSASSKTAYATAARLAQRPEVDVIGLTSARNRAFCDSLGIYRRVLAYDELDALDPRAPSLYVDFAGSAAVRQAIHGRFVRLAYSCAIGGTHVQDLGGGTRQLPGPRPVLFFAPAQVKKRAADWGAAELNRRLVAAWQAFRTQVSTDQPPWLQVHRHAGAQAMQALHAQVLAGQGDPRIGHVISLSAEVPAGQAG